MSHKHCVFCGEEVPVPRPTNWSLVCESPLNTTAPDITGKRYHAVIVGSSKNEALAGAAALPATRVCRNPHHARTDGTMEPHELGSSCMAERAEVLAADELVASRTAWLEQNGVPISIEFVRFANAIGDAVELLRGAASLPAASSQRDVEELDSIRIDYSDNQADSTSSPEPNQGSQAKEPQ